MGFLALRCYACGMFQVKQAKKSSNKWACAVCNEKQSVTKVYGTSGAAKDVRNLVQQLNNSTHVKEQGDMENVLSKTDQPEPAKPQSHTAENARPQAAKRCKWDDYLETEKDTVTAEDDENYVTAIPERPTVKRNTKQAGIETADGRSSKRMDINGLSAKKAQTGQLHGKENDPANDEKADMKQLNTQANVSGSVNNPTSVDVSSRQDQLNSSMSSTTSKWSAFLDGETEKGEAHRFKTDKDRFQRKSETAVTGGTNKWSKYLDDEEQPASTDHLKSASAGKWSKYLENDNEKTDSQPMHTRWSTSSEPCTLEGTGFEDEVVTDDVHPSFI